MSGKALERMRAILNGCGAYRLTGASPADWELSASGAGFDLLEGEIDTLLDRLYPAAAGPQALDAWEAALFGRLSSGTEEDRRTVILSATALNPKSFTPGYLRGLLRACGIRGAAMEENGGVRVLLGRLLGVPEDWARARLEQLLPAHLAWTWDESVTWEALDAWAPDFETLDAQALTWEQAEALDRPRLMSMTGNEKEVL